MKGFILGVALTSGYFYFKYPIDSFFHEVSTAAEKYHTEDSKQMKHIKQMELAQENYET